MKTELIKRRIAFDGVCSTYQLVSTCEKCGIEFVSGNPFVTLYCLECAKVVNREQTRLRVKKWREHKRLKENGYD